MMATLLSAAFEAQTGRICGGPASIPGNGGSGHGWISAGGSTMIFSGWVSHFQSGSANLAPDGSI